jgi:hypothetical protein
MDVPRVLLGEPRVQHLVVRITETKPKSRGIDAS